MNIEQAIIDPVRVLSLDKQEQVLVFIKFLHTDEWKQIHQGRFEQLQQEVQIGIDAAERSETVDANAHCV